MTAPAHPALSQEEAFARIRLLRSPNIGPVSYAMLLQRFGAATAALDALPDLGKRGGRQYRAIPAEKVEREVESVRKGGAKYLFHDQPGYPALLREIEGAPPILTWRGELSLAASPCVAIVGARNASAVAVKLAREFAKGLAEAGLTVVSGLARGIDGAAHEGAFPHTIGVIASGIDIAYPPSMRSCRIGSLPKACCLQNNRRAPNRVEATSPAETASLPGWRAGRWWWKRR